MGFFTLVSVLVGLVAAATAMGDGYELDQNKLDQRRDLIHSIVSAGVPGRGGYPSVSHKPTIGGTYASPKIGYNTGAYAAPQRYGGYNVNNLYGAGRSNVGYGGYGTNRNYGNAGNYGYGGYGNNAGYGNPVGYKLGGGAVHPIFNNNNLYKPTQTYKPNEYAVSDYNNKSPIYIGGSTSAKNQGLYSQSGFPQKTTGYGQPQINAYGNQPVNYNAKDAIGGSYTGQKGTLYKDLPGYSNPYFKQF